MTVFSGRWRCGAASRPLRPSGGRPPTGRAACEPPGGIQPQAPAGTGGRECPTRPRIRDPPEIAPWKGRPERSGRPFALPVREPRDRVARVKELRGRNAFADRRRRWPRQLHRPCAGRRGREPGAHRRRAPSATLVERLRAAGVAAESLPADLSRAPLGWRGSVASAEETIGPIDILVNNAGVEFVGPFIEQTRPQLELITSVNLLAPMELTRVALPGMLRAPARARRQHRFARGQGRRRRTWHTYNGDQARAWSGSPTRSAASLPGRPVRAHRHLPRVHQPASGCTGRVEDPGRDPASLGTLPPEKVGEACRQGDSARTRRGHRQANAPAAP